MRDIRLRYKCRKRTEIKCNEREVKMILIDEEIIDYLITKVELLTLLIESMLEDK